MKKGDRGTIYRPVVWITGASRGIGKETAKQFASLGCIVCLSSRNTRELNKTAREIELLGGRAHVYPMDITRYNSIPVVHRKIRKEVGAIDIVVNNAGLTSFRSFMETPQSIVHDIIETNLTGPLILLKEILPSMVERKKGWIFNIISMVARKTFEGSSVYTASKAGLLGFGKVLREEMRSHDIRVINIIPGPTETEIWHPKVRRKYAWRMMQAKSVAEAILAAYQMPDDLVVDEMVVRPIHGDLN
jgi:3-oxoacyl-[acyl-carrier protein] reductase